MSNYSETQPNLTFSLDFRFENFGKNDVIKIWKHINIIWSVRETFEFLKMSKIETAEEIVPDAEKISDLFFESDQLSNLSISDKLTERDVELLRNVEIEGKF